MRSFKFIALSSTRSVLYLFGGNRLGAGVLEDLRRLKAGLFVGESKFRFEASVTVVLVDVRRTREGRSGLGLGGSQNSEWSIVASLWGVTLYKSVHLQNVAGEDLRKS